MPFVITADSTPVLDGWGWDDYWNCNDWITWHKAMKAAYGPEYANSNFLQHYHQGGFGASNYDCRTFNSAFKTYAKENGFYDGLFSGIGIIMQPVSGIISVGSNLGETVINTTSILKWLVPIALIALAVILLVAIQKNQRLAL